jgi:hypothetical protein
MGERRLIYLSGCLPKRREIRTAMAENGIGLMLTPYSERKLPPSSEMDLSFSWAADNGCFADRWKEQTWKTWIESLPSPSEALFATIPDVVLDHESTLRSWHQHKEFVRGKGFKIAFVLQDGARREQIPFHDMDALFIGGSTEYKLSSEAKMIIDEAKDRAKWIHMGRVNSLKRLRIAHEWGCDSVDGTFLAFAPDFNTTRLLKMMKEIRKQDSLFQRRK